MRLFLLVISLLFIISCGDDKSKNKVEEGDNNNLNDKDVVADNNNLSDLDVADDSNSDTDLILQPDKDNPVQTSAPTALGVTSGGGVMKSENYSMEISIGKPASGGVMKSANYKFNVTIK